MFKANFRFSYPKNLYLLALMFAMSVCQTGALAVSNEVAYHDGGYPSGQTLQAEFSKQQTRDLVILDQGVPESHLFYKDLAIGAQIREINSEEDGIAQLFDILKQYENLDSLHIVSHADAGMLYLGNSRVTTEKLSEILQSRKALTNVLNPGADLFFYGCNLAKGERNFIPLERLARNTGLNIAASTDLTGNEQFGGDWDFEYQSSAVTGKIPFDIEVLAKYQYVLVVATYTGMGANDSGGTGFKSLTDANLVVSNDFTAADPDIYHNDSSTTTLKTLTIKTDGVDAETIDVDAITMYAFNANGITIDSTSTIVFKDSGGSTLRTMSLNGNKSMSQNVDTDMFSLFDNNTTSPVTGVAQIDFNIRFNGCCANGNNWSSFTFKSIEYSNVVAPSSDPTISSATYDSSNGNLVVTGENFEAKSGSSNDVTVSNLTITGEGGGGSAYTLTTSDVEITNATSFTIVLNGADKLRVDALLNKNSTAADDGTIYNLAAADDFIANVTSGNTADATNGITVSNYANPAIASSTYDASTGALVVTGSGFSAINGANNDVVANTFTFTGDGGDTYTLTDTSNVDVTNSTTFTLTLSATDKFNVNGILNKNGLNAASGQAYNLAAADNWIAGGPGNVNIADSAATINTSNVTTPAVSNAAYNHGTGVLTVTGTNFVAEVGANNDVDVTKLVLTGEGGNTHTLTSSNVEITSATEFSVTLNASDKLIVNGLLNKDGTQADDGATNYNLNAQDRYLAATDSASSIADATNTVTVSNTQIPTIATATYDASSGALVVTGTSFAKKFGSSNDIDVTKLGLSGEGGNSYTLTGSSVEVTSETQFTVTLSATDQINVEGLLNKDGTASGDNTNYNLAAAEDWQAGAATSATIADLTLNGVTVSNTQVPTITSATYDFDTGILAVTGTNMVKKSGSTNDVDLTKITLTGVGNGTRTLTTTNVEITDATSFSVTLNSTDKTQVNALLDTNGTQASDAVIYNLNAAEDWMAGAAASANVVDTTNGITVSNAAKDASTTAASFNTSSGTNLTPSFTFDGDDETLTITNATHIDGSSVANGQGGTDTLIIAAGVSADLTTAGFSLSNFENLTLNDGASATMVESVHDTFASGTISGGAGTEAITLSTSDGNDVVTGDPDIEAYTLNDAYTFTLGVNSQDVTGNDSASQTIDIGTFTLTSASDLNGGSGQSDVLQMGTGSSIASANSIAGFETLDMTGAVTMTEAQHDSFSSGVTASGGSDQITISAADGDGAINADADVETYATSAGVSLAITLADGGQSVTGNSGDDTVDVGTLTLTSSSSLTGSTASTADTLQLGNGANITSATSVSGFENLTLASNASANMTAAQLAQFSGTITAAGDETLNISGDGGFTTFATNAIETYSVGDDTTNARIVTLGTGHTSGVISAITANDAVTFNIGTQSFVGTLTGEGTTNDTVQMGNGSSIASATLNNIENLTIDASASVTMTEDQHDAFSSITATGTNQITISAATNGFTGNSAIETYVLGAANSIVLGAAGQNVTGSTGNDTVDVSALTLTSSTINAGDGTDTMVMSDGANISASGSSNFENLTLASGASVTMTFQQMSDFNGGTIVAPGSETITVTNNGNFTVLNDAAIENFIASDAGNNARTITLGSNNTAANVSATASTDAIIFSVPGITYTGSLTGEGTTNDTLELANNANVSGGTLSGIEVLSIASGGSVTLSAAQYAAIAGQTITAPGTGGSGETIIINGTGDITVNSTTVENYTVEDDSSDTRTITLGSSASNSFTASSTSDAITLDISTFDFSGSFTANATQANTLISDGSNDIASAMLSGFTNLTLEGGTNNLTLTPTQLNAFSGTITASGTDTLTFSSTGSITGGNLSAIETFATGSGGSITITIPAADVSGKTLTATTPASDSFTVTGSTGAQTINGSAGGDNLSGGAGADTLSPGAGTDSMSGGDGNDVFTGSNSDLNGDTITDLAAGDTIVLTGFALGTSNVAFSSDNGSLLIDTDGTSPLTGAEISITLSNTAGDSLNILNVTNDSTDTTITFENTNTPAAFSNLDGTPAFTENGSAVVLDDNVTISDTELDALNGGNGNYNGATLTIARNGGANADDEFGASGNLSTLTASGSLTFNSLGYGTVTTNSGGTLVLSFSDSSNIPTKAIVASILQAITYSNSSDAPDTSVVLNWTFNDGTTNSTGTNQTTVTVTPVNDAPVLDSAQSPTLAAINEDAGDDDGDGADGDDDASSNTNNSGTDVATIVTDSSITDADGSAVEAIAVVIVDNTNGVWQYSTDNGTSWNNFSGTTGQSVDLSASARLLDGTLSGASTHKIRFVPSQNYNGAATITFRAWDKSVGTAGGTADTSTNGGTTAFSSVSDSASITVTSVNDAPSVDTNTGVTVERGSNITIGSSALSTSDTEDSAANITYTVTAVPTLGALQLSSSNLSVNDTFTQDDIDNDRLRYVHAGGVNSSDSFSFSVADQNSSQITGQTFSITIQDTTAPTITAVSIPNSTHKVGDTITATITVSSDSDTYSLGSSKVAGYTLGSLSKTNDTTYTATFTVSDGGTDFAASSDVSVSVVLTDSSSNSTSAFTTAVSQSGDAIYANLPDITLSSDLTTIAEDGGVATITASITNSLNNQWPDDIGFTLGFSGTATNTTDYTRSSSSITISAGTTTSTITITSVADDLFDAASDETVIVSFDCLLSGAANLLSGQTQTITITDAESAPSVTLSVNNSSIDENGGTTTPTVTLSNATYQDVTVALAYSGTATAAASGADYNSSASTSITVSQGSTSADAATVITSVDDSDSEGDETIIIDVASVSGGSASESTEQKVTVTISDDDNTAPVFSNLGGTAQYTEDASAMTLDSDVTVTDSENDVLNSNNGNYTGSTLTIARNGGANANDTFTVVSGSQMAVSGTDLTNSIGDKFGSFTSNSGTLTITFSGDLTTPTTALVNEVLQNITYSNSSDDPVTSVQLDWSFSDSQLTSSGGSDNTTVTITPVNDAPTLDDTQSPILTAIEEDVKDGDNSGTSVSAIVVDNSIDNIEAAQTTESIVVTNVDNSNGVWQYTTDNGANWNNFTSTTGNSVDLTSTTSARLLSSSSSGNKIRFVPDQDYNGSATLTFRAWDEASGTNGSTADVGTTGGDSAFSSNADTASISISAVNDAPTIGTNTGLTVDEGAKGVITTSLLADSDPDDTGTELTFTVTTAVTNGTLFLDADNDDTADSGEELTVNSTFTQQDLADGNIQYAHDGGETTSDSFVFSLADGGEDSAATLTGQTFNISITSVNETPVITSAQVTNATEDAAYSYTLAATDVDAGDSLTFAAPTLPSWLSFASGTGVLSGIPTNDDVGSHSVVLTVTDSGNLSATQSFTITVVNTNDAPVISSTALTSATEDSAYSYTLTASDVDAGDSLTMSATTIPNWLAFNSSTGVLSGTPTNDEVGDHSVVLSVSDSSSATDIQSFTITVSNTNDTPVFSSTAVTSATEDSAYSYTVTATDVDAGDSLTFAAPTLPSWLSFASGTGVLSGTPTNDDVGSHSVVLTVTDSGNLSATQSFTITVSNTNDAPVISSTAVTSATEDSAYSYTLTATDVDAGDSLTMTATTLPDWLVFNSSTGGLSGTPTNDEVGDHAVVLSVSDSSSATDSQSFTITVINVNDAPVITSSNAINIDEDQSTQLTLTATDVDSTSLTWSITSEPGLGTASISGGDTSATLNYVPNQNQNGSDTVVISVTDGELSTSQTITVTITPVNDRPSISGTPPTTVTEGELYSFTPSASDNDGDSLTFSASNLPEWLTLNTSSGNIAGLPNDDDVGTYSNIILSVSDGTATASLPGFAITVTNVNEAPEISGTPASLVEVDTAYRFVPDASDADGDTLTFSVENLPAWLSLNTATGAITGTPTSADVAEYENIILTVSDGELSASLAAFSIEVIDPNVNIAPVVEDVSATTDEDTAAEITLLGSDFNDDSLSYAVVTEPENGTVVITNNIATYTPASDFNGTDSFTYQASDSILNSESATVTVTVSPVNDAPTISGEPAIQVAFGSEYSFTPEATDIDSESLTFSIENMPEWASFDEDTGTLSGVPEESDIGSFTDISISVSDGELEASLAAFEIEVIDPNANTAPIASDSAVETEEDTPVTFTLEASDEDGDTLTYTITTEPASGTIEQDGNSITYTPNANVGDIQDSLSFTVTDGVDTSEEATVTIDIIAVNDAPEISGTPATSVRVGMVYEFIPAATDVENDTLTFAIENQPRWAVFDGNTGTLSGTPGTSDVGTYGNITISVSDGTETVSLAVFNVEVIPNSRPLISGTSASAVEPGQSYSFTPVASDPDGDTLTFSIENQPDWTSFDTDTGSLSGIPGSDDIGNYSNIIISVTDGIDTVSLEAFNLEVCEVCGNVAPTISGLPVTSVTEGGSYLFTPSASDINGDELTFSIVNQPAWANFDSNTGTLSGTPGIADVGTTTGIVISVTDGEFTVSLDAFSITVLEFNDAPVINGTPATSVFQNDEYRFTPTASDAEGDTLVFSISNRPSWAAFNTRTGTLRGTPVAANVGSYSDIVISVNDGQNTSTLDSFSITVVARNNAPTISGTPRTAISQSVAYSFTPTATDADGDSLTFSASGLPDWLSINSATGALTGTPGADDVGTTGSIVLSVSDGTDSASLSAFTITVTEANAVPVANNSSVSVDEDASVSITPLVSDGDGDDLSFVIVSDVQNGSLTETATGWTYTPDADFNGSDSFVYQANDGESSSEQATVSITVNSINDRPVAVADTIVLDQNDTGIYTLNVLANDIDVDIATNGDVLTLQGVQADFGVVSVVNNQIQFEPGLSFIGDVDLQYALRDNARRSAQARVNLTINGVAGIGQPILTVPDDLTVDAEGLFTEVDLGVAEATDADGNPLPVSLVRASNSFKPGARKVFWRTEDSFGSVTTDSQTLHVNPLISLGKDKVVNEDSTVRMRILLNGDAPVYPLTVNYTVSGTATFGEDHNAQSGSVTFNSGREQIITFNVFSDDEVESDETIIFTLNSGQNLGANNTSVVTISEENIAPEIRLMVSQSGDNRLTVAQDEGSVVINATVTDANPQDSLFIEWTSSGLLNSSSSANQFLFEPSDVATGIYQVSLFASDNGDPILSNTADVFIEVVESLATLSDDLDTDGDLIPDSQEGYADADGDGIPDYLDAIDDCNVVPAQAVNQDGFLAESEPGVCLRQGAISALNSSNGVQVILDETTGGKIALNRRGDSVVQRSDGLPEDPEATNIGGVFDFILYDLPEEGQIASIVLPQTRPVPSNAVYRKYSVRNERWTDFVINDNNQVFSARGAKGVCPPPGSPRWVVGLTEGHWCVQLRVLDGGINDDDGLVNGAIADPGGVAVVLAGNSLPDIQSDEAEMQWNTSIEIDVLVNDSDVDGDTLTIESVDASFGTADITSSDTIIYTPDSGYVGTDVLIYAVSDGNGGTGSGEVTVTINGNRAPGARSDSATTTDDMPIEIDVLANDTDVDGDPLTIDSASVDVGEVVITANNTLLYTPANGFDGLATITYVISDSFGETDSATVSVVVDGNQSPQAMDDSVNTEYGTSVVISVLDNDMDVDGDNLTIVSATADSGSVVVNSDQTLTFTPATGFSGQVTITYVISDGELTDEGTVRVTVAQKPVEIVNVTKKSGGGAFNLGWLMVLLLLGFYRQNYRSLQKRR